MSKRKSNRRSGQDDQTNAALSLAELKMLSIDFNPCYEPLDFDAFSGDTSCFDYDLIIWDPSSALDTYSRDYLNREYRGLPNLESNSSVRAIADIQRRRTEFAEFLRSGRLLVVIVRPPQRFYFDTGKRTHSGTGRNRQTTVSVSEADIWDAFPFEISIVPAKGSNIDFRGGAEFAPIWQEFRDDFRYEAYIASGGGSPIMGIARTDKLVGSVIRHQSGGAVVLLPVPKFVDEFEDDDTETDLQDSTAHDHEVQSPGYRFQQAVIQLARVLASTGDVEPMPAWTGRYRLAGEAVLREKLVEHERKVEEARALLAEVHSSLSQLERRMQLVTATGRALELQVREVLKRLGGEVSEPAPGRDDWKVTFPEGKAVIEVKGLTGSAREKDAAQLEKWVSTHIEETNEMPKGILVVNGWRSLPLEDRTDPVFPHQMLKYSEQRGHCLVSGLQMLGILQDLDANPDRAEFWRKELFATTGVLDGFADWSSVLDRSPTTRSSGKSSGASCS